MERLNDLVIRARTGDLEAFGQLVAATQAMAYAAAKRVLRDSGAAQDAAQEAYLRAFRRIDQLDEPAGFVGWLLAWGVFTEKIVRHVGGDPAVHTAIGVGYGLERFAMLRYGIDDIRKIEAARVA